jgi:hypothetical protein
MFNEPKQPIQFRNSPMDSHYHQGGWQLREGRYNLTAFSWASIWFLYWDSISIPQIVENDFHGAFEAWKNRWACCICSQGDYFEADSSQNWVSQHFFFDLVRKLSDSTSYFNFLFYLKFLVFICISMPLIIKFPIISHWQNLISGADVVKLTPTGPETKNDCLQGSVEIYPTNWLNLSSNWG